MLSCEFSEGCREKGGVLEDALPFQSQLLFAVCQGAVNERSSDVSPLEPFDLILHQRDQGRDNQGQAWSVEAGQLVDQGFTGSSWHDYQCVSPRKQGLNCFLLSWTKALKLELFLQSMF